MEFSSDVVTLTFDAHVATLWLDRPEARNALGSALWRDLPRACTAIEENPEVRVVVLAARGPHFSVGLDLKELGSSLTGTGSHRSPAAASAASYAAVRAMQASVNSLADLAVPVVAAVHGYCIGGGVDLICAADIRLASSTALFSVRETKVAIVADLGTLQRLPRIIGAGHVAELAFTGEDISAERAAAIGLVNSLHGDSDEDVIGAAHDLARRIAANSPLAVKGTKAVLRAAEERAIADGLDFVARWNTMYLKSNDLAEAMSAFAERRAPVFRGD